MNQDNQAILTESYHRMFLNLFYIIGVLLIINVFAYNNCSNIIAKHNDLKQYFSTKTPYRIIKNINDMQMVYPGCRSTRLWSIIRHGSRNPSKKIILLAKDRLMKIREKILSSQSSILCERQLALLRNWKFNVEPNEEKFLVYEGEDELIELGERMQNRFPNILKNKYDPDLYKFKYTATQRTMQSARSYAYGLFGKHNNEDINYLEPLHKDPVLRFYKLCKKWKKDVDKNPDTLEETKKFLKSDEMKKVIKNVKKKAGITNLSIDDLQLMYTICSFESAWNKHRSSIWCSFFDYHTIQALEFARDLKYYWNDGYGYDITHKQACPAFVDMITHVRPQSHHPNVTLYFTHSGTILKLLSHLGLYKDDFVLTHNDFRKKRQFRTSKIDAFASNLSFILYRCKDDDKLLVLHQERVIHLPGCPETHDLCKLKTIEKLYRNSIENCDFDEMCRISSSEL